MKSDKSAALVQKLEPFVPSGTAPQIVSLIVQHKVQFRITRPRNSKLGDYRPPGRNGGHRISINGNLNPYAFYITTLHEFAHLIAFDKHGLKIAPHGQEWKSVFSQLLHHSLQSHVFPDELHRELMRYLKSPSASSCSDHGLMRALRQFDQEPVIFLEEVPDNSRFVVNGNRVFVKGPKQRTRYRCLEEKTNKMYLISGIAEVEPLD